MKNIIFSASFDTFLKTKKLRTSGIKTSNCVLLFLICFTTFIFSAENSDLRQQFLGMTIAQAHEKYGNSQLKLDINSHYMGQHPETIKLIGEKSNTVEYKILLKTLKMIASDFKDQEFDMYALLDPEKRAFSGDSLTFAREEISNLTIQQLSVMLLANNKSHIASRQELNIFANLPPALQEKIKPYYYFDQKPASFYRWNSDSDHRIKINCRQKITRSNIIQHIVANEHTFLLLFGLGSLLYTRYIIKPQWDTITGSPDSSIIERNAELEITNNLIDSLKKNNTPGAENLIKTDLANPLRYTFSDGGNFIKPLLPISTFLHTFIASHAFDINKKNHNIGEFIKAFGALIAATPFFILASSLIPMAYYNLDNNVPSSFLTLMTAILAGALVWRIKNDTQNFITLSGWKNQSIEFEKDKTVAECINKYLSDPNLEIK